MLTIETLEKGFTYFSSFSIVDLHLFLSFTTENVGRIILFKTPCAYIIPARVLAEIHEFLLELL